MMNQMKNWIYMVNDIADELGWHFVNEEKDGYFLFEQYSSAGEDFCVEFYDCKSLSDLEKSLSIYSEDFNPEEHAIGWYGANRGEPDSLTILLEDAIGIKKMLDELSESITILNHKMKSTS